MGYHSQQERLEGVVYIYQPSGYGTDVCGPGTPEYVRFYLSFDNGATWDDQGMTSFQAYNVPEGTEGSKRLEYAVSLAIDPARKLCFFNPLIQVRAILSWNLAVPCADPNKVPTWGNREETLINIAPSAQAPAGKIAILGGIPVSHIDGGAGGTGLTKITAVFATNNLPPDSLGRACPFAGRVTVQGAPLLGHSYKVEVTPALGGAPAAVVTNLVLTRLDGTTFVHTANAITGRFSYLPFTDNVNSVLAQWDTTGDAKWEVTLSTFDAGGNPVGTDTHLIQLDNTGPVASITITTGTGDCGKFSAGMMLAGNFVARDDYLGSYSLGVEGAANPAGVGVPSPNSGLVNTLPAPGDGWSLDTTDMRACGYVIRVVAVDRAIVNSQAVGHHASDSKGFCLEEPEPVEE